MSWKSEENRELPRRRGFQQVVAGPEGAARLV